MLQLSICKKKNPSKVFPFLVDPWTSLHKDFHGPILSNKRKISLHIHFFIFFKIQTNLNFSFWVVGLAITEEIKFGTPLILVRPPCLALIFLIIGVCT